MKKVYHPCQIEVEFLIKVHQKNINYMKLDSKNRIKNPIAIKDKIKNQENNISLMGFRHTNTITFTTKSSLNPKDYKKQNFFL